MLTKKQNLLETIRGGHPDRYVNQYEAIAMVYGTPYSAGNPMPVMGGPAVKNAWGVTISFPEECQDLSRCMMKSILSART